jgi:hypothetical protein
MPLLAADNGHCLPVKSLENGSLKVKVRVRAGTPGGLQPAPFFSQLPASLGDGQWKGHLGLFLQGSSARKSFLEGLETQHCLYVLLPTIP